MTPTRAVLTVALTTAIAAACTTERLAQAPPPPPASPTPAAPVVAPTPRVADPVVARFADQTITASELEARAAGPLLQVRQQAFDIQRSVLEGVVFDRLVTREAKAQGIDDKELLRREVEVGAGEPAADQVNGLLKQYRQQLPADEALARKQVVDFLQNQAREQRMQALKDRLFAAAKVDLALDPPRATAPIRAFDPVRGEASAPVEIVEFSDFLCPFCKSVQPTLKELLGRYPGSLRLVFKQMPLDIHAQARLAATASLCAAEAGKFWEYHDSLFAAQDDISRDKLIALAGKAGIDGARFGACLDSPAAAQKLEQDIADAHALAVEGTPRFLINGRLVDGAQPLSAFVSVVEHELRLARSAAPTPKVAAP